MEIIREFFGIGGYQRTPEGYMSWQHLTFVTSLLVIMAVTAVLLGRRNRHRTEKEKNLVLIVTAIAIDSFELIKIVARCIDSGFDAIINLLPLFLCSVQLIAIPLAAFSKGRLREAALDFVSIFGLLGALLGTYGAGQNYNAYPVLSADNVISGLTHAISGFAALYILISGMASMKRHNIPVTYAIIMAFCVPAYLVNKIAGCNYMFLMQGDGTPYDILYNLVGGSPVLYPLGVILLFFIYIAVFYQVYFYIQAVLRRKKAAAMSGQM